MELIPLTAWKQVWKQAWFRTSLYITGPALVLVLFSLTRFLEYVEQRPGVIIPDPVLGLFPARDVTWITFAVIYVGILGGVFYLIRHPVYLLRAIQGYIVMVLLRMVAMFLLPLEPPATMIPLKDPFVEYFGTGRLLTKDLFFSGHTSTLFLLFLTVPDRPMKVVFFLCTVLVAVCVLLQHVHYAVDVLAAPVFAYAAYRMVYLLHQGFQIRS